MAKQAVKKQAIKLKVGGKSYSLNIDSEKEELYRLAERELNQSIKEYESQNFVGFSAIDYLSITALKFAIDNLGNRLKGKLNSEDMNSLKRIEGNIGNYLNDITKE